MKLKYLVNSKGLLMYQRRFPDRLKHHPQVQGKSMYWRSLELRGGAGEEAILRAWKSANKEFEDYIALLELANIGVLDQARKIELANAYLAANGLKPGMLATDPMMSQQQNTAYRQAALNSVLDADVFNDLQHSDHPQWAKGFTPEVEIQSLAWKIVNEPSSVNSGITTLFQCWDIYEDLNELDMKGANNKMAKSRYLRFVRLLGDQPLTQTACNSGLVKYVETREQERAQSGGKSPSASTIKREVNAIKAVLHTAIERRDLDIVLRRVKIKKTVPATRHTFTTDQLVALANLVQDKSHRLYAPWKELMYLLMVQTGIIQSELQRLRIENVHLDHKIPHIDLVGELKDEERVRTNPIVYKVDRIKELIAELDDGRGFAFGPYSEDGKNSKTVNKALVRVAKLIYERAGAGTYPCRHAFRHNCRVHGVDTENISALGGWSGKALGLDSESQLGYGKAGAKYDDMMRMLRDVMLRINSHLFADDTGKVISLPDRKQRN